MTGLMASMQDATLRRSLHARRLQVYLIRHLDLGLDTPRFRLSEEVFQDLNWWAVQQNACVGVSLVPLPPSARLYCDASLEGWGAHLGDRTAAGVWAPQERSLHINVLEMLAVHRAITRWRSVLLCEQILLSTDNTTVVAYVNRQGGTISPTMLETTFDLFRLVDGMARSFGIDTFRARPTC